jgi:DNA-binding transcriptional ArsR family regulator
LDITHPTIAKAFAHPLRIEIMGLLENRVASPSQLATELGAQLPRTSYHVRQLASMGLIRLVGRQQKRGSIEHFYTAAVRPTIYDADWSEMPGIVKQALIGGRIAQLGKEFATAARAGGFDREEVRVIRTRMTLSPEGWRAVAQELADVLDRIDQLGADEADLLRADPDAERIEATSVMMLFESPPPAAFDAGDLDAASEYDALQDVAPPS